MASNILVLGAGELGFEILKSLANLKQPTTTLTVLLRHSTIENPSPNKAAEISLFRSLGISILAGDITTSDLPALFKPYDLIISCLGFSSGPGSQIKIAKAVLEANVKRYVPWQFGVDYDVIGRGCAQDLFDEQLDVRDLLRFQTATEWVIVSTGMFTSFLFEPWFGVVDIDGEGGVVRALGSWENKVTVTSAADIGKLVGKIVLAEGERRVSGVVFTAGETLSYGELAVLVESVLQKQLKKEVWSVEDLKERLQKKPDDTVAKYRVVFAEGKGVSWDMEKTWNFQNTVETEKVQDWARKHLVTPA